LDRASSGFPRAIFIVYHAGSPVDPETRSDPTGRDEQADRVMDKSYLRDIDPVKSAPIRIWVSFLPIRVKSRKTCHPPESTI
jgi:hypothetical protein